MTTLAFYDTPIVGFDVLRDLRHRDARAARDVADWLAFLKVSNKAPRTLDTYERTAAALLRAFPDKPLDEFTSGDLLQLLAVYPPKSRGQNKAHLSSLFGWACNIDERIPRNPVDKLPKIRYRPTRTYDTFTDAETEALCGLPSPDGALMTLLLWAGLRRAEARHLTVKRLDFDRGKVLVVEGAKGEKDRQVPMLPRVARATSELILLEGLDRQDYLWYDTAGGHLRRVRRSKPIADSSFTRWWQRAVDDAGVRYRNPHTTRHTYASALRELGVPIEDLQDFLGHESYETTASTYVHSTDARRHDRLLELLGDKA